MRPSAGGQIFIQEKNMDYAIKHDYVFNSKLQDGIRQDSTMLIFSSVVWKHQIGIILWWHLAFVGHSCYFFPSIAEHDYIELY